MNALTGIIDQAVRVSTLPTAAADEAREQDQTHPWPIVLISLLGAVFSLLPILATLMIFGGMLIVDSAGVYVFGVMICVPAVFLLRKKSRSIYLFQVTFSLLLVGDFLLIYGILRDFNPFDSHVAIAACAISTLQIMLALALFQRGGQIVLGMLASVALIIIARSPFFGWDFDYSLARTVIQEWSILLASLSWTCVMLIQSRWVGRRFATSIDNIATGWVVGLLLVTLMTHSTQINAIFNSVSGSSWTTFMSKNVATTWTLLSLSASVFLLFRWHRQLDRPSLLLMTLGAAMLALMSWHVAGSGAVVLVLLASLATSRWRMAGFAAFVLVLLLGGYYYSFAATLLEKAALLGIAGLILLLGTALIQVWMRAFPTSASLKSASKDGITPNPPAKHRTTRFALLMTLVGAALTLTAANISIYQNETIIRDGKKLYVALAPRDPRSLMQGDYMALNFALPRNVTSALNDARTPLLRRAHVLASVSSDGVASVLRMATLDETLGADEVWLPVVFKNKRWVLVSDAFFFPEGTGKSLESARFGELRALPNGRALLVALVTEDLEEIQLKLDDVEDQSAGLEMDQVENTVELVIGESVRR